MNEELLPYDTNEANSEIDTDQRDYPIYPLVQVGTRGTRGTHSSTIRDQEGLAGRRATTGKARGGVVGDGDDAEEHPWVEEKNAGNPPTVHLPTLR